MTSVYLYWIFAALMLVYLIESVSYAEVEEASSADKSPKHFMIFSPKNILTLGLVVSFLLISILINR